MISEKAKNLLHALASSYDLNMMKGVEWENLVKYIHELEREFGWHNRQIWDKE